MQGILSSWIYLSLISVSTYSWFTFSRTENDEQTSAEQVEGGGLFSWWRRSGRPTCPDLIIDDFKFVRTSLSISCVFICKRLEEDQRRPSDPERVQSETDDGSVLASSEEHSTLVQ